ncbi:MAG: hypothetical protein KJP21_05335 [Bacteroidia bacterium]|nr:hypothetical protein [Bacteroidia bacterium]NNJ56360.1 hypothetical protein [Bacteroidia bacterium]
MTPSESFKGDFFKSIWEHTLKMLRYSLPIGIAYFAVTMAFILGIITRILDVDLELYLAIAQNPLENQAELEAFSQNLAEQFLANWPILLIIFLVMFLFQAYIYAILVKTSQDVLHGKNPTLKDMFSNTDLRTVLNIFLASISIVLIYSSLAFFAMMLSSIHALLSVAMFLFIILFLMRFIAFLPGIVLGKLGVIDSLRYSLMRVTWNRAAKLILISFALGVAFLIALMVISTITMFLGSVGNGINFLLNIAIQIFMLAGISALYTGLHYRYIYEDEAPNVEEE